MITRMIITIMIINIKNLIIVNIKNILKTSIREERKESKRSGISTGTERCMTKNSMSKAVLPG